MNEGVDGLVPVLIGAEEDLSREFDARLADSSSLAIRVAFSVLRQRQDAEDVAQEAFLRAFRHFARLRDRDRFRAWLVRTTWRLALDSLRHARRRAVREQTAATLEPAVGNAEVDAIASDRATRLWAAIDTLRPKLRLVVVLAAIEGHGTREVASLLRIPEGTVKSRLFEARRLLEERLR